MPRTDVQTFGWTGRVNFHVHQPEDAQIRMLTLPTVDYSLATERRLAKEKAG